MVKRWLLLFMIAMPAALQAQQREARFAAQDTTESMRVTWRPIRIAKWATLLASTGAAAYGFAENQQADEEYEAIERECEANPALCAQDDAGVYTNPALEQRYQRVVDRDDSARLALLVGQIGIAASVVMFILDLPDTETTEDIPYDPRSVRFRVLPGSLGLSVPLPNF